MTYYALNFNVLSDYVVFPMVTNKAHNLSGIFWLQKFSYVVTIKCWDLFGIGKVQNYQKIRWKG